MFKMRNFDRQMEFGYTLFASQKNPLDTSIAYSMTTDNVTNS